MKKKYSSSKVEWEYIGQIIDAIDNPNTKNQVRNALEWYVIKANRYRVIDYILNGVTFAVPAALVIFNNCVQGDCIIGQLLTAASGMFAAAAKSFSKLHDKRIVYRRAAEAIKSEAILYIHQAGIYGAEDRNIVFVNKINEIRKSENSSWAEIENNKGAVTEQNFAEQKDE